MSDFELVFDDETTAPQENAEFSLEFDSNQPDFTKVKREAIENAKDPINTLTTVAKNILGMAGSSSVSDIGQGVSNAVYNIGSSLIKNSDTVGEYLSEAPKALVASGLKAGEWLGNIKNVVSDKMEQAELYQFEGDNPADILPEAAKGLANEGAVVTTQMMSNMAYWLGMNMKDPTGKKSNDLSDAFMGISETMKNISEYMGDVDLLKSKAKPLPDGSLSYGQIANISGHGIGQGGIMALLSATVGPKAAYGFYSLAGAADTFKESYEKEGDVSKANTLASINAATTYMIDRWIDPLPENIATGARMTAKQVGKEVAKAAIKEPASESLQQVLAENLVRKIGIDPEQDLFEAVVESAIGAFGGAAAMGGASAVSAYSAERHYEEAKAKAVELGADPNEVEQYKRATLAKLKQHPEAFDTVFQQNLQKTIQEIDTFVKENGSPEEVRKAMQTKADLDEVYNRVYEQIKKGDNDKVAAAQAKVVQGVALWGAQELGISPLEYYEQRFPRIERTAFKEFNHKINQARRASEKPDINIYEALKNPDLLRGHRKKDKRASLTKFLQSRGGLVDAGGELKGMDANKQVRGLINNKSGNNLDDAALAAWEAGYFPQNSERPSINELLEAIDEELRGNKRFASEAEENLQQQVNDLAEELDRADIDWRNMEPKEIEMAVDAYVERQRAYLESMGQEQEGDNGLAWFQFGGPRAKTAALDKLETAKQLDAEGLDNEQIRQQTGWFKGMDGKWRFEISDKDSKITLVDVFKNILNKELEEQESIAKRWPDYKDARTRIAELNKAIKDLDGKNIYKSIANSGSAYSFNLDEVLKHDKLFAAYPEFRNIQVRFSVMDKNVGGYIESSGELTGDKWLPSNSAININVASEAYKFKDLRKVLTHEVQHIIQQREAFARGGSTKDYDLYVSELRSDYRQFVVKLFTDAVQDGLGVKVPYTHAIKMMEDVLEGDHENKSYLYEENKVDRSAVAKIIEDRMGELQRREAEYRDKALKNIPRNELEYYKRLAGEIEANNTTTRINFSDKKRAETPVEETQEYKNADAIVIFDDGSKKIYNLESDRTFFQKDITTPSGHVVKPYTDRNKPSRLLHRQDDNMLPEEKKAWDDFFASRSDADRIKANLEKYKGTPWERLAREQVFVHHAINLILDGKTPDFESALDTVSYGKKVTSDINSIASILREIKVLSGGSGLKTVHSVNSSFLNCNPTPGCAKYCYAASALLGRTRNWLKPVLIDTLAENRPDLLAQMIVDQFKVSPLGVAGNKAIRLFDEGDGAPHWINVIKEINNLGYRVAIFTKRKEFAWEVINNDNKKYGTAYNLVMFSSDASNFKEIEGDDKIPVAFVYSDESEIPMIKKMSDNGQVRVILPIKLKGGKGIANEVLQELFNEVPEVRPHVCPIDAGFKKIDPRVYVEDGDVKLADKESRGWNCAFCDRKGGVGCYFGFSTEKMDKMINKAKELKKTEEADMIDQFRNLFTLIEALKQGDYVNDRRYKEAGIIVRQDKQGDDGVLQDVATSATGRRGDLGWLVGVLNKRLSDVSGAVKRVSEAAMPDSSSRGAGVMHQSSEGNSGYDAGVRDDGRGPSSSDTGELSVNEVLYQDKDNTLYRDPKGAYSRRIGQRALISLFERADASTFMHETAHFFFEELKEFAKTSKKSADMLNTINEWLGYDGVAYTEAQIEQFARGFEQYLREGKAPSNYLKRVFDAFLSWMRNLYKTAKELNVQLNDDVRSVYANILGGTELDKYMEATPAEVLGNSKKYWEAKRKTMDEIYAQNIRSKDVQKRIVNKVSESMQKVYDDMRDYLADAIVPLEEEIKQISPDLYNMNRRLEISKINKTNAYYKRIKGFVEGMSKMDKADFHTFDLALKNRDVDTVQRLLAKYDLEAGFAEVRNILDDLREQMIDVGVDVAYMPDYFPRKIKDADGLLDYVEQEFGDSEQYSIIQKMLEEKRKDGRVRTKEDEAQIVNSLIRGYAGGISIARIGNVKERSIDVVDQHMNKYYKLSTDALVDYISGAVQMIENKKYFGRETKELQNLRRMVANRETTIAEYKEMEPKEAKWKEIKTRNYKIGAVEAQIRNTYDNALKVELQDRKTKLEAEVEYLKDRRAEQVKDIAITRMEVELAQVKKEVEKLADSKIENSIGNLLQELSEQGKIGHTQERRLQELLMARFSNKGLGNEFWRIIRDGGYIWTLGNFESAITQFGDLGTSAYKNGLWNTFLEYGKAWAGKSEITVDDLGLGKVINDGGYADTSAWSKALDKVLKYTGFEKMDKVAKQTQVNAAIRKARQQAKDESPELEEYLRHEFGEKWVDVKEDLKTGAITDEIMEYAMFQLFDVQPITIDQMPRYYAEGGKKRLFYMMKSYFIKQLNEYRKVCFETAKTDPMKALIDMLKLTGYLMLFNAGADVLKDLLMGRVINVTDTLVNNVFIGGSINRYQAMSVKREGLFKTLQKQLMFPVMMDEVIVDVLSDKDVANWNTWKNIPLVGRPYYWWFGGGHLKNEKDIKKARNARRNQRRKRRDD